MNKLSLVIKLLSAWAKGQDGFYEILMKNKKVLDLGCGEGKLLKHDKNNIYGIDINQTLVSQLSAQGYHVQAADVTSIPFEDNYFGVVHCSNVIEHLDPENAYKMFKEMKRVLKKDGLIILITPMPKAIWNTFGHVKPYPPMAIKKLFRQVSLEKFDSLSSLRVENIIYFGSWSANKFTFLFSSIVANLINLFRGLYVMVIRKYE